MIDRWRGPVLAIVLAVVAGAAPGAAATAEEPAPSVGSESEAVEQRPENGQADAATNAAADEEPFRRDVMEARLQDLRVELLTVADFIRAKEQEIAGQQSRIDTLAARQAVLLRGAAERRQTAAKVLFGLQGVARVPPLAILARSNGPIDVVRSGVVLSTVVDELARRAETARAESERIAEAQEAAAAARRSLSVALEELHAARGRLAVLIDDTAEAGQRLQNTVKGDDGPVPGLIAETQDLAVALTSLTAAAPASQHTASRAPARDDMGDDMAALTPWHRAPGAPVSGRIVVGFGDVADGDAPGMGTVSKGVRIETPPRAAVVAPSSGRVAFVGPFRGYGLLLIIDHGGGYHSLMAGFDRIDLVPDQEIAAADPIGVMGDVGEQRPSLYIELRRDGQPVNPLPWFVQVTGKANG